MFCDVHRLSVYLNMLIVTVVEIHSLILDVCMIMQPPVSYADLLLKVFQINLKTVGSSIRFHVNKNNNFNQSMTALNYITYESHKMLMISLLKHNHQHLIVISNMSKQTQLWQKK